MVEGVTVLNAYITRVLCPYPFEQVKAGVIGLSELALVHIFLSYWKVQDEEEEGIGDVDLFSLSPEREQLLVNAKWLQHLQASFLLLVVLAAYTLSSNHKL